RQVSKRPFLNVFSWRRQRFAAYRLLGFDEFDEGNFLFFTQRLQNLRPEPFLEGSEARAADHPRHLVQNAELILSRFDRPAGGNVPRGEQPQELIFLATAVEELTGHQGWQLL